MLRHETILGLLDLSQVRGVKPACVKLALKGVPDEVRENPISAPDPTAQAQVRGAIGSFRILIVKPKSARVIMDKFLGRSKGFGLVEMGSVPRPRKRSWL